MIPLFSIGFNIVTTEKPSERTYYYKKFWFICWKSFCGKNRKKACHGCVKSEQASLCTTNRLPLLKYPHKANWQWTIWLVKGWGETVIWVLCNTANTGLHLGRRSECTAHLQYFHSIFAKLSSSWLFSIKSNLNWNLPPHPSHPPQGQYP